MLGELVQTAAGKWITHPPASGTAAGTPHGPDVRSDGVRPPLNTHWAALDGPATVRISNVTEIATVAARHISMAHAPTDHLPAADFAVLPVLLFANSCHR
jgi:hypothetical protein